MLVNSLDKGMQMLGVVDPDLDIRNRESEYQIQVRGSEYQKDSGTYLYLKLQTSSKSMWPSMPVQIQLGSAVLAWWGTTKLSPLS